MVRAWANANLLSIKRACPIENSKYNPFIFIPWGLGVSVWAAVGVSLTAGSYFSLKLFFP